MRLAFFASHNGSSAKAITEAAQNGRLKATPALLISNNPDSPALHWATAKGLEAICMNAKNQGGAEELDFALAEKLKSSAIDLVLCSGYMRKIGPLTLAACPGRIVNVHPALLPAYGGEGMYGHHVHQAVLDNGDSETGITIHVVDAVYDHGKILAQKKVPVVAGDTLESLEARVKAAEPSFYVETVGRILSGAIALE